MRFRSDTGEEIRGATYKEVVSAMARLKLQDVNDLLRYREAVARRVSEAFGTKVDPATNRSFVRSLEGAGLLERL